MAKDKKSTAQSPTIPKEGYPEPPNPADALRSGPLPVRHMEIGNAGLMRRGFNIPTKATLHRQDGLDGAAEVTTVKERRFNGYSDIPPYPGTQEDDDGDFGNFGAKPGQNANKYSKGDNSERTSQGQIIRGT